MTYVYKLLFKGICFMSQAVFELKGSLFTISVIHINEYNLPSLSTALKEKVSQAPKFFYRAPVIVNIDLISESDIDFTALKTCIESTEMALVGITGGTAIQKDAAKEAGLPVLMFSNNKPENKTAPVSEAVTKEVVVEKTVERVVEVEKNVTLPTKIIEGTVRSGQQIYAQGTDLIIKGAVSAGAEVIADGNIHIYGTLRGRAIAGAQGNTNARIYCSNVQAELVSINGNYWLSDALQEKNWSQSACIQLVDNSLSISELV